jgi:hypothetical protein
MSPPIRIMGIKDDVDWRKIADAENVKSIPSGFL